MYTLTKVTDIEQNNVFNIKINYEDKMKIIEEYNLTLIGEIKEYWINNVNILSNNNELSFNYIVDKNIDYYNNYLINNYDIIESPSFSFYKTDQEEKYILYRKMEDGISFILKDYDKYLVFEISGNDLSKIKNNII